MSVAYTTWYYTAWWTRQGNVGPASAWQLGQFSGPTPYLQVAQEFYQDAAQDAPSQLKAQNHLGYLPFESYLMLWYWPEFQGGGWRLMAQKGPIPCIQY